jgi:iron complex transport system permease protein
MKQLTFKRWSIINVSLLVLLAAAVYAAVSTGSEHIDLPAAVRNLNMRDAAILFSSRLPRVLMAVLVGMALASAGGAFQALLRNPLADPFILGVSGGAALGSVLAVGFHLSFAGISMAAFLSALVTMILIFSIARTRGRLPSHTLLLTGVIFNAFCFALILFVNAVVTMEQAYQIVFLLIGNLESTDYTTLALAAFFILTGFVVLIALAQKMNVLSLGDETAGQLGVNSNRLRFAIFFASSLMVGSAVAVSGLIGFVGLFIPHIIRLIFGPDHRLLIPASGLLGAAFLAGSDAIGRTILMNTAYQTELPVGVITALIGAPFFVFLLKRQQKVI